MVLIWCSVSLRKRIGLWGLILLRLLYRVRLMNVLLDGYGSGCAFLR